LSVAIKSFALCQLLSAQPWGTDGSLKSGFNLIIACVSTVKTIHDDRVPTGLNWQIDPRLSVAILHRTAKLSGLALARGPNGHDAVKIRGAQQHMKLPSARNLNSVNDVTACRSMTTLGVKAIRTTAGRSVGANIERQQACLSTVGFDRRSVLAVKLYREAPIVVARDAIDDEKVRSRWQNGV
jgi:hypothetical protein